MLVKVSAAVSALVVCVLAVLMAPRPPALGPQRTGDAALARDVLRAAGEDGYQGLSVALLENGRIRYAGLGTADGSRPADERTAYEIGSITKTMTGMLLADLAEDGLSPDTPVRDLLPRAGLSTPATLAELASHRSGLPRLPVSGRLLAGALLGPYTGADPYGGAGPGEVLAGAAAVKAGPRGTVAYSNLGMSLLGLALAERFGTTYADLLRTRLLTPLGMTSTVALGPRDALPARHATGRAQNGLTMDFWRSHGYAPAGGGVWSTAEDLAKLVGAVMNGSAPGAGAATPRWDEDDRRRVGYGWFTTRYDTRTITWHNGGTGGFTSFAGYDPATRRGVVVLSSTAKPVDAVGLRLLGVPAPGDGNTLTPQGIVMLIVTFGGLGLLVAAARGRVRDRLSIVGRTLSGLFLLLVARNGGPWEVVPPFVWLAGAGVLAAAVALAVLRWPALPLTRGRPWWRWASAALPAALLLALALAMAG
ncbi:Beta-lactamase [[Actinomadura] parvosata subsp. kistnae]|uniref:serine hydrolase domain-containing protein n=1 Tax=[Actinomadura] parvosata TaxID=1955412 RepID=UPI000D27B085|nr:Beta-lactamase [Actinomadura parvosata subsp. kistnae]